jgi:hypothetical protein
MRRSPATVENIRRSDIGDAAGFRIGIRVPRQCWQRPAATLPDPNQPEKASKSRSPCGCGLTIQQRWNLPRAAGVEIFRFHPHACFGPRGGGGLALTATLV